MRLSHHKHGDSDWRVIITISIASALMAAIFHWEPPVNGSVFLQREGAMLQLVAGNKVLNFGNSAIYTARPGQLLTMRFAEAAAIVPEAVEHDHDAGQPRHALGQVRYAQLWPGIDLVYEQISDDVVEATWYIAAGAAPEQIQLEYDVLAGIENDGRLLLKFHNGAVTRYRATAWQQIDGRRHNVNIAYQLKQAHAGSTLFSFSIAHYDSALPLFIDPGSI